MQRNFGQELRRLRIEAKLTMADLADVLGWSVVYISDIERSRRNPPSAADIEKMLVRLNRIELLPTMLRLAAESRRSIVIPVDRLDDAEVTSMLVALARQVGDGALDREAARKIQEILNKRIDE